MVDDQPIVHDSRSIEKTGERGASAVEYGLLIAGAAALIVVMVSAFGGHIHDAFNDTCDSVATGSDCVSDR